MTKNIYNRSWNAFWKDKSFIVKLVKFGRKIYNLKFLSILQDHLNVNSFCELGCGSSTLLSKISKFSNRVVGIDYSEDALKSSRNRFKMLGIKTGEFLLDNCIDLKTKERFDTVWSSGLLEHFDNPPLIIKKHLKITKKGGYAIISVPFKYSYHYFWYLLSRIKILRSIYPWPDQVIFSKSAMVKAFNKTNSYFPYTLKLYVIMGLAILKIHKK